MCRKLAYPTRVAGASPREYVNPAVSSIFFLRQLMDVCGPLFLSTFIIVAAAQLPVIRRENEVTVRCVFILFGCDDLPKRARYDAKEGATGYTWATLCKDKRHSARGD